MTRTNKLITAFFEGKALTAAQIRSRYGLRNPSATVSDLRYDYGMNIVASRANNKNAVTKYSLAA